MTALRRRMLEDMRVRNLAPSTQKTYIEHVARFARYAGRSPAELGPDTIRAYQVYLTTERHVMPASLAIAVAALRFLYGVTLQKPWPIAAVIPTPRQPQTLPVILSPAEVVQFLDAVKAPHHRTILTTCYAAGWCRPITRSIRSRSSSRMLAKCWSKVGRSSRPVREPA